MIDAVSTTSLADPRRSRRAIKKSCNVDGMVKSRIDLSQDVTFAVFLKIAGFQNRPRDLLDKQRDALRLGGDLFDNRLRQRLAACGLVNEVDHLASLQVVQLQHRSVAKIQPGRRELRPIGHNDHYRQIRHSANDPIHQLERGWIDPVRVLEKQPALDPGAKAGPVALPAPP